MSIEWVIVGLGNPGEEYASTRHNIGFRVADAFVAKRQGHFVEGDGPWLEAHLRYARKELLVAQPTTYMNRSGLAARQLLRRYGVSPEQLIVVVDEYNFPLGRIHLKLGGSDGGHNGIASVITELGTDRFWRLRCGIGRNFGPGELVEYVLSPFSPNELPVVEQMIGDAVEAIEQIMKIGITRAATEINAKSKQRFSAPQGFGGDEVSGTTG